MATLTEILKEKVKKGEILVLRDYYHCHASAQTCYNLLEKDSIKIDLANWRYRSSHKSCWAGDPPNTKGYITESEDEWKELPKEFILEKKSIESSSGGSIESCTITYYVRGKPPLVIYRYRSNDFACRGCSFYDEYDSEDCEKYCPYQYEKGTNILE